MTNTTETTQMSAANGYGVYPTPKREGTERWRPNLLSAEVLLTAPTNWMMADYFSPSTSRGIPATRENAKAFGRALALAEYRQWTWDRSEGRWGYMSHVSGARRIRVGFVQGICQVEESYYDFEASKWQAWTPHMIAAARTGEYRGLVLEEVAEGTWYVSGQTYSHRSFLKQQGGVWNPSKKAFKMTRGITAGLAAILFKGVTKYHILAVILSGRSPKLHFGEGASLGANEAREVIRFEGFVPELWYITGYDWKAMPRRQELTPAEEARQLFEQPF